MSSESVALTRINVLRGINICEQIWKSDGSEHICSNRSVQIYFALMKYYCHGTQTLYDTCTYLKVPLQFSPAEGAVCKDFVLCCEYKCDLYLNQLVYSQCCDPHKDTLPGLITGWGHNLKYEKHKHFFTQQRVEKHKQMTTALWSNQFDCCFSQGVVRDIYPPPAHLSSDWLLHAELFITPTAQHAGKPLIKWVLSIKLNSLKFQPVNLSSHLFFTFCMLVLSWWCFIVLPFLSFEQQLSSHTSLCKDLFMFCEWAKWKCMCVFKTLIFASSRWIRAQSQRLKNCLFFLDNFLSTVIIESLFIANLNTYWFSLDWL